MTINSPFATTKLRRLWAFLGLWAVAISSIIFYIAAPRANGVASALQIVGIFYYNSQVALRTFASAATIPISVVLLTYGILATVFFAIAVVVLIISASDIQLSSPDAAPVYLFLGMLLFIFLWVLTQLPRTAAISLIELLLRLTPPALSLSPIAVIIAIVTSYIP